MFPLAATMYVILQDVSFDIPRSIISCTLFLLVSSRHGGAAGLVAVRCTIVHLLANGLCKT